MKCYISRAFSWYFVLSGNRKRGKQWQRSHCNKYNRKLVCLVIEDTTNYDVTQSCSQIVTQKSVKPGKSAPISDPLEPWRR